MKLVYTHENVTLVTHFFNVLNQAGIQCLIKNQFSTGGAGELAMGDVWPELWVVDERQFEAAKRLISEVQAPEKAGTDWRCDACGQDNADTFEICWQCQAERPVQA